MKKLLTTIATFFIATVTLSLSGCLPTFKYPVVDSDSNKIDKRLYGMWVYSNSLNSNDESVDDSEYAFVQFLPSKEGVGITHFTYTDEDGPELMYFLGYPALVDGIGYLNFRIYSEDDDNEYYLIKYEITNNNLLKIIHVDENMLEQLLLEKKIKGEKGKYDISITEDKTELLEIIKSQEIFDTKKPVYYNFKDIGLPRL